MIEETETTEQTTETTETQQPQGLFNQSDNTETGEQSGEQQSESSEVNFLKDFYNDKGVINREALKNLPDKLKPFANLYGKYNDVESLLEGMGNLSKLAGKKGLEPLLPDATDEEKAARNAMLAKLSGAPEKAEDYEVAYPEGWDENSQLDEASLSKYKEIFHKHGASPELVADLTRLNLEQSMQQMSMQQDSFDQQLAHEESKLVQEFGNEASKKVQVAHKAMEHVGLDPTDPSLQTAASVKLGIALADRIREHRLVTGQETSDSIIDPEAELRDMMLNKQSKWYKLLSDGNEHALKRKAELIAAATKK